MELAGLIPKYANNLGVELQIIVDLEAYIKDNFPSSYYYYPLKKETHGDHFEQLAAKAIQEMVHSRHGGTIFLNAEQTKVIGINHRAQGVNDDFLEALKIFGDRLDLKALNLAETNVTSLKLGPDFLGLVHIEFSRNKKFKELSISAPLTQLKTLDAYECSIEELSLPPKMDALYRLDLSRNEVLNSVTFKRGCKSLVSLHLSDNALTELHLPSGFDSLAYVYIHDNQLASFTYSHASDLPSLRNLHVRNNKLTDLPQDFLELDSLENFYAHGNDFKDIPEEFISNDERGDSYESVRNYLNSLVGATEPLWEAKMILIGNGNAGKTSLLTKLIDRDAPLPQKRIPTPGLDLETYPVSLSYESKGTSIPVEFTLNAWDFGGQGHYREVQQLFCSRKSLYIFVEAVDDEKDKEYYIGDTYWLNMARAYGADDSETERSPIIYVKNKIDISGLTKGVNEEYLEKEYPEIHAFLKVSCKEIEKFKREFDLLEETIKNCIPKISEGIFKEQFAKSWLDVKRTLESRRSENHITYQEYLNICEKNEINESSARSWIRALNNIGTVIFFEDHPELKDWVILNPLWVRDAIYRVIDDKKYIENGILKPKFFEDIWKEDENGRKYEEEEYNKFVALMKAYYLCYEQENEQGHIEYIIPSCFSEKPPARLPEIISNGEADFRFKIEYNPFIPAGMVNKLIVKVKRYEGSSPEFAEQVAQKIHGRGLKAAKEGREIFPDIRVFDGNMWKHNVLLHEAGQPYNVFARIEEVWNEKAIYLDFYGHHEGVYSLYEAVIELLDGIKKDLENTKRLKNLTYEEQFLHPDLGEFMAKGKLEKLGLNIFPSKGNKVDVQESPQEKVKRLVTEGKLGESLNELKRILPSEEEQTLIVIQNNLLQTENAELKGILDRDTIIREKNKIGDKILTLCEKVNEEDK